jgi:ABC-type Fe3+ transport system substrate-binding protein
MSIFCESWREKEERESLERMRIQYTNSENIIKRQRGGEKLILYTNYLGHLRVKGEEDPDVTFCIQNDDTIWFPEPVWKGE